jgi:uncharacterized delta-60 repeat protein
VISRLLQSDGDFEGRLTYDYVVQDEPSRWYRIVPRDSAGIASEPSNSVLFPTFKEWAHTWGGSGYDYGAGIAADYSGYVYTVGKAESLGAGSTDAVLLKYSRNGELILKKTWGGSEADGANAAVLDGEGNLFVAAHTRSFDAAKAYYDIALLKYTTEGELLWQTTWGGPSTEFPFAMAIDPNGGIYIVGYTDSFGAGRSDALILKYDSNGNLLWRRIWGLDMEDEARAVVIDSSGDVLVAGSTRVAGGGDEMLLLKYSTDGELRWAKAFGGYNNDAAEAVALDKSDNIYMAGRTLSFIDDRYDVMLLKLSPDGEIGWQRSWSGDTDVDDYADAIVVNEDGIVYVAGSTINSGEGFEDVLFLGYSQSGDLLWQRTWGSYYWDYPVAATLSESGVLYLTGGSWACGNWGEVNGTIGYPNANGWIPDGVVDSPQGEIVIPSGVETEPEGVIDDGGGSFDILVMKVDPQQW